MEYFQRAVALEPNNGEVWGAIGHCFLMMDDLPKAYSAYQKALSNLANPKVVVYDFDVRSNSHIPTAPYYRNRDCGTASVSFTIAMDLWSTLKRPSLPS